AAQPESAVVYSRGRQNPRAQQGPDKTSDQHENADGDKFERIDFPRDDKRANRQNRDNKSSRDVPEPPALVLLTESELNRATLSQYQGQDGIGQEPGEQADVNDWRVPVECPALQRFVERLVALDAARWQRCAVGDDK